MISKMTETGDTFVLLDGDELRNALQSRNNYDRSSRIELAKIYSRLASLLSNQGLNVIVSTVSLFHEVHIYNRKIHRNYREVFLEVDLGLLKSGPRKDMYMFDDSSYLQQIVPEFPVNPDLHLKAIQQDDRHLWLDELIQKSKLWLSACL